MSAEPPNPLHRRTRLPFEPISAGNTLRQVAVLVYAVLVVGLAGLALYMGVVVGHPLTGGYVAGPAIGALWFGLRLFMMLGSKR